MHLQTVMSITRGQMTHSKRMMSKIKEHHRVHIDDAQNSLVHTGIKLFPYQRVNQNVQNENQGEERCKHGSLANE